MPRSSLTGEFYKMEFDAWDEGTIELTLEEEAAYLRLCHQMYRRHGPVPNSERLLCSIWRCHQNKARPLLKRLIEKGKIYVTVDGHLANTRVTQELDTRDTLVRHRAHAGHTGGIRSGDVRRKSLKNKEPDEAVASHVTNQRRVEERREEKKDAAPTGAPLQVAHAGKDPKADFYARFAEVWGPKSGGMATKLLKAKAGSVAKARAAVEQASEAGSPRDYLARIINGPPAVEEWEEQLYASLQ